MLIHEYGVFCNLWKVWVSWLWIIFVVLSFICFYAKTYIVLCFGVFQHHCCFTQGNPARVYQDPAFVQVARVFHWSPLLIYSHLDAFSVPSVMFLMAFFLCSPVMPRSLKALHRDWPMKPLQQTSMSMHCTGHPRLRQSRIRVRVWLFFSWSPPPSGLPKGQSVPAGPLALLFWTSGPCLGCTMVSGVWDLELPSYMTTFSCQSISLSIRGNYPAWLS